MFPSSRLIQLLAATALAGGLGACATVTQEDPPSQLDPAAGGRGSLVVSGSSGGGGTAPIADVPAPVARPPGQSAGMQDVGNAGVAPPPAVSAGAGSGGAPATTRDAGPQFATGTTLLQENFENFAASAGSWVASTGSTWEVRTDPQQVSSVYTQTETGSSGPHLAVAGNTAWRDVVVDADFEILSFNGSSSSYMAGLCVRVRDAENFYLVGIRSNDGKVGLRRYSDGGTNLVQSTFNEGTTGVWYHLKVEVVGDQITAYLDDTLMFSETDSTLASGGIALCTVRATASFDNVSVTAP